MNTKILFNLIIALVTCIGLQAQTPAFPGAEGAGAYTTGGRSGKVLYVTSLEDGGDNAVGTLRWAVKQSGTRTVMFKVSGIIQLKKALKITEGNLTIAGQTAPGDGICIKDFAIVVQSDNVIIRFMRFRMGDEAKQESDAFEGNSHKNIIVDHCSMSWSTDECSSFYDNQNFTMQWCIIAESLRNSVHGKGSHGYGAIWGGQKASFHHNLLTCHDSRNPRFCGSRYTNRPDLEQVDFRNNVIYNWGSNNSYAGEGGSYNMVNNYYKAGPASSSKSRMLQPYADDGKNAQPAGTYGKFYINGNYVSASSSVSNNNWNGVSLHSTFATYAPGITINDIKSESEFNIGNVKTHTAEVAFDKVIDYAGCSLKRDILDTRYTNEAKAGTTSTIGSNGSKNGIIDTQSDAGGWPVYNSTTAPSDSNNDGIPDGWLEANGYGGKVSTDKNEEGYTYLEVYLNSLVQHIIDGQQKEDPVKPSEDIFCGSVPVDKQIPDVLKNLITNGNLSIAEGRTDACTENGYTWRTKDVTFSFAEGTVFSANFTSNGGRKVFVTINGDEQNKRTYDLKSSSCESVSFDLPNTTGNTIRIESFDTSGSTPTEFSMIDLCIKKTGTSSIENSIAQDKIRIKGDTLYAKAKQIDIYSVKGNLVNSKTNVEEISLHSLERGVYIAHVKEEDGTIISVKFKK